MLAHRHHCHAPVTSALVVLLLALICLGSTRAHAASAPWTTTAWSAPQTIAAATPSYEPLIAAIDPQGRLLAGRTLMLDGTPEGRTAVELLSFPPAGAVVSQRLAGTIEAQAPSGPRSVVLVHAVPAPNAEPGMTGPAKRLLVSDVDVAGSAPRTTVVAAAARLSRIAVAANARGAAVVAWTECCLGPQNNRTYVRARTRPSRRAAFGPTITLAREPEPSGVAATVGANGDIAVVWSATQFRPKVRNVLARVRAHGARVFGPRLLVGRHDGSTRIAATTTSAGRLFVVWGSQDGGEEANQPYVVRANQLARGARRFGTFEVIDRGTVKERPSGGVAVVALPRGGAVAVWNGAGPGYTSPLRTASANSRGTFGRPVTLAAHGPLGRLVVSPEGTVVVSWSHFQAVYSPQPTQPALFSATRAPGGRFGAPELIATGDHGTPTLALDPSGRRLGVMWLASSAPPTTPLPPLELRLATRTLAPIQGP